MFLFSAAFRIHAPGGAAGSPAVPQHQSHSLEDGDHLGRRQPSEGLSPQHAGPPFHAGLEMGFFY